MLAEDWGPPQKLDFLKMNFLGRVPNLKTFLK